MKMVAKSKYLMKCSYGCCDAYRSSKDRRIAKHMVKRIEKRKWQQDLLEETQAD